MPSLGPKRIPANAVDPTAVLKGYVLRTNSDGTQEFVRWDQADTVPRGRGIRQDPIAHQHKVEQNLKQQLVEGLPPIVKRTPQERLEAMWRHLIEHTLDAYRLTGEMAVHPDLLAMAQREHWKAGQPVSQEMLKEIATRLLTEAEHKNDLKARLRKPTLVTETMAHAR